ncbi:hypothetical protein [Kutzneria sp. CA-103260]|uniref:hypothetical protein n=1 Tax=Kutzneria sp. CA-103260 TaxID=2802641 RepID=UPI001BA75239|nr:hypothetical protein [Kutzneria sp. CA-103260]QUQ64523.1 hypothetical protein JJ691_22430 [Kutzneria sp. CA-103260]
MIPNPRVIAVGLLVASGLVLTACGGSDQPQAQVPMLPATGSSAATSGAATTSADPGQPRERLDMTNDELNALYDQFNQCLSANGLPKGKPTGGSGASPTVIPPDIESRARAACKSKDPLPPWELDASNPHGADFVHAVVQCLRAKGVRYVDEEPPQGGRYVFSFGGANNDSDSISKGLQYTPDCEKQVAGQGIGH